MIVLIAPSSFLFLLKNVLSVTVTVFCSQRYSVSFLSSNEILGSRGRREKKRRSRDSQKEEEKE
jgi:hypothetical protein